MKDKSAHSIMIDDAIFPGKLEYSKCGHVIINGKCHQYLEAKLSVNHLPKGAHQSEMEWLESLGFDALLPIGFDSTTFVQFQHVECSSTRSGPPFGSVEEMRKWMRSGCQN